MSDKPVMNIIEKQAMHRYIPHKRGDIAHYTVNRDAKTHTLIGCTTIYLVGCNEGYTNRRLTTTGVEWPTAAHGQAHEWYTYEGEPAMESLYAFELLSDAQAFAKGMNQLKPIAVYFDNGTITKL